MSQMTNDNGIGVRVVDADDHDRVLDFLRIHYYLEEPLTVGSEPKQQDAADEEFNMSNIGHGTCLMAVQTKECATTAADRSERIVGAVMAGPKQINEADHLFEEAAKLGPTKWGQILQFLACVERDANVYERYGVDKTLHAHVLGVDTNVRGQGIGARLMKELMSLAKCLGYPLLTIDCTSVYSALLCERMGMECVHVVHYKEYLNEEGHQVFCPPEPHDCVKTFAIRL